MNTICSARKANGDPCTLPATDQLGVCWAHSAANAEQRRQTARKGGRGRANTPVKDLQRQLDEIVERVLDGTLVPYRGSVAAQLINTRIRLIELDHKLKEREEIEARLDALERQRQARVRGGAAGWRG